MPDLNLYWRGRVPLGNIRIEFDKTQELFLSPELEAQRKAIWHRAKIENSDIYDGRLLVLTGFENRKNAFVLTAGFMTFSRVLTLHRLGVSLDFPGSLGVQALIFSPDMQHIVWGKRSLDSIYCPGFFATPRGMLEIGDADNITEGILREIKEEIVLDFSEEVFLVAIAEEFHGTVGAGLIVQMKTNTPPDITQQVRGNEEWIDNTLEWHSVENLIDTNKDESLDALVFAHEEWKRYSEGLSSVVWSQKLDT